LTPVTAAGLWRSYVSRDGRNAKEDAVRCDEPQTQSARVEPPVSAVAMACPGQEDTERVWPYGRREAYPIARRAAGMVDKPRGDPGVASVTRQGLR